jgi:hypothetical protein
MACKLLILYCLNNLNIIKILNERSVVAIKKSMAFRTGLQKYRFQSWKPWMDSKKLDVYPSLSGKAT